MNENQRFWNLINLYAVMLQVLDVALLTGDISNKDLAEKLHQQNTVYLEKIVEQNEKILEKLERILTSNFGFNFKFNLKKPMNGGTKRYKKRQRKSLEPLRLKGFRCHATTI